MSLCESPFASSASLVFWLPRGSSRHMSSMNRIDHVSAAAATTGTASSQLEKNVTRFSGPILKPATTKAPSLSPTVCAYTLVTFWATMPVRFGIRFAGMVTDGPPVFSACLCIKPEAPNGRVEFPGIPRHQASFDLTHSTNV